MRVVLVNGPAAGREFDIPDGQQYLRVPYLNPEAPPLTAVLVEDEEGIRIEDEMTFLVAEYQRSRRFPWMMQCINPLPPKPKECPCCHRPL